MTPEEKERVRLDLIDYITGTVDEWCMNCTSEDRNGARYRIAWEYPTDGAMIANLSETPHGEPVARYGVQIIVDTLPDVPPLHPDTVITRESSGATTMKIERWQGDPKVWTPATFLYALAGDRIRIGTDETDVLRSSSGAWHANVVSSVLPSGKTWDKVTPWEHTELRLDLSANPGFREYPAETPCEILCTPERLAVLTLMTVFPGTKEIKP